MRTKTLLITAALMAAGIASSQAQAVYSANMVGYINKPMVRHLNMVCNQLNASPNNSVKTLFGDVGTLTITLQVSKFDPAIQNYRIAIFGPEDGWTFDVGFTDMLLTPGEGAFIDAGAPFTWTQVGEVPLTSSVSIPAHLGLIGMAVPQSLPLDDPSLGFQALINGKAGSFNVLLFNPAVQDYVNPSFGWNNEDGWAPNAPTPGIADAMFVDNGIAGGAFTWNRTFAVGP